MKISKIIETIIGVTLLCVVTCKETTTEPTLTESEKLLLTDNEVSGWGFDPSHTSPEGTATTIQQLSDLIDGGYPDYTDRGWVSTACKSYWDGNKVINLQVYEQKNSDSALSVFNFFYPNSGEVVALGDTAVIDTSALFGLTLHASDHEFFIRITVKESKEDVYKNALISFGQKVESKITNKE